MMMKNILTIIMAIFVVVKAVSIIKRDFFTKEEVDEASSFFRWFARYTTPIMKNKISLNNLGGDFV